MTGRRALAAFDAAIGRDSYIASTVAVRWLPLGRSMVVESFHLERLQAARELAVSRGLVVRDLSAATVRMACLAGAFMVTAAGAVESAS